MWIFSLNLHVNQKSDDDDDDKQSTILFPDTLPTLTYILFYNVLSILQKLFRFSVSVSFIRILTHVYSLHRI